MRRQIAAAFLACQFAAVVYAQFTPRRYFCWAPNDYVTEFSLKVTVGGRVLAVDQALGRYQFRGASFENVPAHVIDIVEQYEQTYGKGDHAQVAITWKLNGKRPDQEWRWPPR
jgi:hypothetical protein